MATTNKVSTKVHPTLQNIFQTILEVLGVTSVNLSDTHIRLTIETTQDGQFILARAYGLDGNPANADALPPLEKMIPCTSLPQQGVQGTLVAGVLASVALANKTGDLLVARAVSQAGTPGACYSVQSVDSGHVKVISETAAGAAQTLDTSVVAVYNFGNPAL